MKRSYRIAGIKFTFEGDFEYKEEEFYEQFRVEDDTREDYYFKYIEIGSFREEEGAELVYSNERFDIYVYNGKEYRCFKHKTKTNSRYSSVINLDGHDGRFYYIKGYDIASMLPTSLFVFNNQILEKMLIEKDAFILHSSYIIYNGRGILFSAPSGTGKSTQADLWEKYEGAVIVNGDRAILKKESEKWYVHSLPMCGSSNICRNISAPLDSIVLLRQAPDNVLVKAGPKAAFSRLYRECTVNSWNEQAVSKVFDMLMDICSNVKVYEYGCTKEREAVEVLKREIDGNQLD